MDLFSILSKGANINRKQKSDLKKLNGLERDNGEVDIESRVNFFSTKKPRHSDESSELQKPHILRIKTPEEAAEFRRSNKTKVTGDPPLPIASFDDLVSKYQLDEKLRRNLRKKKFEIPTPIQSESIPAILESNDLIACAPTGSGKTLAFVTPIIQRLLTNPKQKSADSKQGARALIVSPTRELANQIYEVAVELSRGHNLNVCLMNKQHMAKLRHNNAGKKANMDFIISTPMRLVEGYKEGLYSLDSVEMLVLDEADKLLGHGFVEQTDEIVSLCTNPHIIKAVFSATMPSNIEELAQSVMSTQICRVIVGHKEGAADTVEQELVFCGSEAGKLTAIRQMMVGGNVVPPILVFVQSIQRAKALFHELLYDKINVDVIHSELTQPQREAVVNNFKSGDIWVLICTDVLARGIDFQGINLVINYDVPLSAQSYVHRIGRTGRAGRRGKALTFYTKEDVQTLRPIVNVMKQSGIEVSDWLLSATSTKRRRDQPIKRDDISTVPKVIKHKKRQRQEMIEASKRRKDENKKTREKA